MMKEKVALPKKDHRQLNQDLKFFLFLDDIGSALPIWLPRGLIVKRLLKTFFFQLEEAAGFQFVSTPLLAKTKIYQKSGHFHHYQDYIFPSLKVHNQSFLLRPMTCPHHCLIFAHQKYSYQDLPVRFSENSLLFRQEASGALHGLERVRQMELKDSHIFLPQNDQLIIAEIKKLYFLTKQAFDKLGIIIDKIYLSLPDFSKKAKFSDDQAVWTRANQLLEQTLEELELDYQTMVGEAAFYGPKIDFQITTALNHDITISTIQLDFFLATKFQLKYRTAHQTKEKQFLAPVILHHGIVGTYERLLALLLESNNGWLPFWLSPTQVMIFLVDQKETTQAYSQQIFALLKKHQLRLELANPQKSLKENVRRAWKMKIPVQLFLGQKEKQAQKITYLLHSQPQVKNFVTVWQFLNQTMQWNS